MAAGHRLFFALEPDEELRAALRRRQQALDQGGRAVAPEQFHVTLVFLGLQPATVMPELCRIASGLSLQPCTVRFDRCGSFRRSSVLWLGASTVPQSLTLFRESLAGALSGAGISFDQKRWAFHLTLYRRLRKPPPIMATAPLEWRLDGFSLMESVSVNNGVEYHRQGHWKCESSGD